VIYLDSSVALARLLFEPRSPPQQFWQQQLVSSRLLEYEVWNRVHAYGLTGSHADDARVLLTGIELVEMDRSVLARALEPLPVPLRTLDALHLATMDCLHSRGERVKLASYDHRLMAAAQALGVPLAALRPLHLGAASR
jgi:predicted nucleic acid-binding protein